LLNPQIIAIVDDDASVLAALVGLIRSLGYVGCPFSSAQEFLNSEVVRECACVISDIQMPGMSGIELQKALQDQGVGVPVIFVTAFPDERVQARAIDNGALCVLHKPFTEDALISCLQRALRSPEDAE
jgi:FixJ family two-component response regulator